MSLLARFRASLANLDREVAYVFLLSVVAQSLFWYFGRAPFFEAHFPPPVGASTFQRIVPVLMHFAASFVLLGLVSLFAMRWLLRRPMADFGLQLGDVRLWWRGALLSYVVFAAPSVFGGSALADVGAEYPLAKAAASSLGTLGAYGLAYGVYYVAWEIHFRGFILFGLEKKLGAWPAIFCQTVPSVLIHAGKPPGETFAAIIAGVVWGWLALESRSILGPLLAHWALGVTNDLVMSIYFHGLQLW